MLEGMYSAAAGMAAQQQRLDALSNDLANMNTAGYKGVRVAFRDLLYTPTGPGAAPGVASGAGAAASFLGRDSAEGALQSTGVKLDVALAGPGYIEARDSAGRLALTRNGSLQRESNGRLMTATGEWTGVTVPPSVGNDSIEIDNAGRVHQGNRVFGRLRIVDVPAPDALQAVGDSLFRPTAASGAPRPVAGAGTTVQQGMLEASDVDVASAMTDMTDAQRAFEFASKAITTQDKLYEIANGVKR